VLLEIPNSPWSADTLIDKGVFTRKFLIVLPDKIGYEPAMITPVV
jgi:hypothetical protein